MSEEETQLCPVRIALHTADRERDYHWSLEAGAGQGIGLLVELHRGLIADQEGGEVVPFILLDQGPQLGMVAKLQTQRRDRWGRPIDDTLLLEFDPQEREAVFRLAAALLAGKEAGAIQLSFLEYAEARFQQKQETGRATVEPIDVPSVDPLPGSEELLRAHRIGLRCNDINRCRVAGLLHAIAITPDNLERPFVVVSTGFVGRDRLQQHASRGRRFIALTRSPSFPADREVALEPVEREPKAVRLFLALLGLLGISLLVIWLMLGNGFSLSSTTPSSAHYAKMHESPARPSSPAGRAKGSGSKFVENGKAPDGQRALTNAASTVALGASPLGTGMFQVISIWLAGEGRQASTAPKQ